MNCKSASLSAVVHVSHITGGCPRPTNRSLWKIVYYFILVSFSTTSFSFGFIYLCLNVYLYKFFFFFLYNNSPYGNTSEFYFRLLSVSCKDNKLKPSRRAVLIKNMSVTVRTVSSSWIWHCISLEKNAGGQCVKGRTMLTGRSTVFLFASALNWLLTPLKSRSVRVTSANLTQTQEEHFPMFPSVFVPAHYFHLI